MLNPITTAEITIIAISGAGTARVKRGIKKMISIVEATSAIIIHKVVPFIQANAPVTPGSLKCCSWERKITIARPLTNPSITG